MSGALRLAYIGAGGFTNRFMYPQLSRHNLELAAVCDLDEAKALKAQREYGFKNVYTDFNKMCDIEKPDVVICVGGPVVHYEVGMQILDRGLPLYVQKSPAPSAAKTREMAELAKKRNVVCHVGFNLRSSVAAQKAKAIMARPDFGRPTLGIFRYGFIAGPTWQFAVMDQNCHAFDLARYMIGHVKDVKVSAGSMEGVRNYVVAVTYENGAVGTINFTSEQGGREFIYYEVTGERGNLLYSHQFNLVYRRAAAPPALDGPPPVEHYHTDSWGGEDQHLWMGYVPDLANFLAAVRGTEPDRSPVADSVGTMELCEEVYRQLRELGVGP